MTEARNALSTAPIGSHPPLWVFFIASAKPTTWQTHRYSRTPIHETLPTVTVTTTVIPEPATLTLLALGSLALLRRRGGAVHLHPVLKAGANGLRAVSAAGQVDA